MSHSTSSARDWWRTAVFYEIVPDSFYDSDGDGIGDLNGIRVKLEYLVELGVDALWIGPIYKTGMRDFGYDVQDYRAIDRRLGTLEDFDRLLAEAHERGLRILLDFVPNHTSDEHPWFLEASASRDSPKRHWYLWAEPSEQGFPNNWLSIFGGSAWQWHPGTQQFYYHTFTPAEADLNWRNRAVRDAVQQEMRFWLERGVDGFRLDGSWYMIKDIHLRDDPESGEPEPNRVAHRRTPVFSSNRPEVHDVLREFRDLVDQYQDRVLMAELYLSPSETAAFYGVNCSEAHLPSNTAITAADWRGVPLARAIAEYEAALPANCAPNWILGNHDISRVVSRLGPAQAPVAAMLQLTLRGAIILYYGEEIGMADVPAAAEERSDPQSRGMRGGGNRTPFRTPMQWKDGRNAGFTTGNPWLPVMEDLSSANVKDQQSDPDSLWHLYKRLIQLRKREPCLTCGDYFPQPTARDELLAFMRKTEAAEFLVVLNLSDCALIYQLPGWPGSGTIRACTRREREGKKVQGLVDLAAGEGVVIQVK